MKDGGPLYLNTRTDRIMTGSWYEGPRPDEPGQVELDLSGGIDDVAPRGEIGYRLLDDDSREDSGEWNEVRRFRPGIDPEEAEAWLVDVDHHSILQWMEPFDDPFRKVILDLRETDRSLLYQTMNVRGWLQSDSEPPEAYHPHKSPTGKTGKGPVFMLVHGFTGDPINWAPVCERLEQGPWSYVLPLLPGHGQSRKRLAETPWKDWRNTVRQLALHLKDQGHDLIGLGLSMGGSLLIENHQLFDAVVTVNTPWTLHDWRAPLLPLIKRFKEYHFSGEGGKIIPVSAIHELYKLQKQVRATVSEVETPALVLSNRDDDVIPPEDAQTIASKLRYAESIVLDQGGHESPSDPDAVPPMMDAIKNWLDRTDLDVPSLSEL